MSESKPGGQAMNERERFEKAMAKMLWPDSLSLLFEREGTKLTPTAEWFAWTVWQAALSPAPPAPSCHVCGKPMTQFGYQCSCGATTGVSPAGTDAPEELAREILTDYGRHVPDSWLFNANLASLAALLGPRLERAERWIPVGEALPKFIGEVQIKLRDGSELNGAIWQSDGDWWWAERFFDESLVTHWRPLPSAPDTEEKA